MSSLSFQKLQSAAGYRTIADLPTPRRSHDASIQPFAFFPAWLPDELAYSTLARYGELLGAPSSVVILDRALGHRGVYPTTLLPRMRRFVEVASGSPADAKGVIVRQTAYNYLAAFMDKPKRADLMASLLEGDGQVGRRQGATGTTRLDNLVFCPRCLVSDMELHGQGYWRVYHQLPGVYVCPVHKDALVEGAAPARTYKLMPCDGTRASLGVVTNLLTQDFAVRVAEESAWLVVNGLPAAAPVLAAEALQRLIRAGGWDDGRGRIKSEFGRFLLERSGLARHPEKGAALGLPVNVSEIWIRKTPKERPPVGQLLALVALERTARDLADEIRKGVAEPRRPERARSASRQVASESATERNRKRLLRVMKDNPQASRQLLSGRLAAAACRYLSKVDHDWLERHLPSTKEFDWAAKDREMASEIPSAVRKLLAEPGPPRRISPTRIAKKIATVQRYYVFKQHLPLTQAVMKIFAESVETARMRSIAWAAYNAVAKRRSLKTYKLRILGCYMPSLEWFVLEVAEAMMLSVTHGNPQAFMECRLADLKGQYYKGHGLPVVSLVTGPTDSLETV